MKRVIFPELIILFFSFFFGGISNTKAQSLPYSEVGFRVQIRDFQGFLVYDSPVNPKPIKSQNESNYKTKDHVIKPGYTVRFILWYTDTFSSIRREDTLLPKDFRLFLGNYQLKTAYEASSYFMGDSLYIDFPALVREEKSAEELVTSIQSSDKYLSDQPLLDLPFRILRKPFKLMLAYIPRGEENERNLTRWEPRTAKEHPF